jgi:LacI family sucrose operon transcriptional repressor
VRKTKRVTIKDIAELAGVSKATASLVLNGRSKELRVAEETRERVLAIAKEHHYQPSIHARSLRDNRSHTIGLVVPEITNYGFAVFSHELETLCREAGVQLLISCSDENPGQETVVVNNMVARQVDGLIVASSMLNDADYHKLSEQLPVVLFDRHINDSALPLVITDSITPTTELVADIARQHPDEFYFLGGQPAFPRRAIVWKGLSKVCVRPAWRCAPSGSFTATITRAPVTRCLLNSAPAWGVRRKRCSPPPAGCWKGCCAIWASITCCKAISG